MGHLVSQLVTVWVVEHLVGPENEKMLRNKAKHDGFLSKGSMKQLKNLSVAQLDSKMTNRTVLCHRALCQGTPESIMTQTDGGRRDRAGHPLRQRG